MRMKKIREKLIMVLMYIVILAAVLFISKWIFEAVYYSDMPEWLKYVLLR